MLVRNRKACATMNNTVYTNEYKERVLERLQPPESKTISEICKEEGIKKSTTYGWVKKARDNGVMIPNGSIGNDRKWRPEDKIRILMETYSMNENDLGEYCRRHGLYSSDIEYWTKILESSLAYNRPAQVLDAKLKTQAETIKRLEREIQYKDKALAETAALLVLKKKSNGDLGGHRGRLVTGQERLEAIRLIEEARDNGARLEPACEVLNLSPRTYQRWVKEGPNTEGKRPAAKRQPPKNKLSQEERAEILTICNSKENVDLSPAQIIPKLADNGIYVASESSFYRVLRAAKQNAKRRPIGNPHPKPQSTHVATAPNQVWTWDITWLPAQIKGHFFKLYLIMDIFSRMIVGWEIHEEESEIHAQALVKKTVFKHCTLGQLLVLHSDNGSPMKAQDFQSLLAKLGITKSYSRPRVSNDNPFSEALFKTLKYIKDFPVRGFESIDEARRWVSNFVTLYNETFMHSGIRVVTPYERHHGLDIAILAERDRVYKQARDEKPERWSGNTRDWSWIDRVALNPIETGEEKAKQSKPHEKLL